MEKRNRLAVTGVAIADCLGDDGIEKICSLAEEVNFNVENIGARRLHTVLEKVLEDISFNAPDLKGKKVLVDAKLVEKHVGSLSKTADLRKYVL